MFHHRPVGADEGKIVPMVRLARAVVVQQGQVGRKIEALDGRKTALYLHSLDVLPVGQRKPRVGIFHDVLLDAADETAHAQRRLRGGFPGNLEIQRLDLLRIRFPLFQKLPGKGRPVGDPVQQLHHPLRLGRPDGPDIVTQMIAVLVVGVVSQAHREVDIADLLVVLAEDGPESGVIVLLGKRRQEIAVFRSQVIGQVAVPDRGVVDLLVSDTRARP